MSALGSRGDDSPGPAFAALLTAACISNLGDGLRSTALPLLAEASTSSPLLIGGMTAAQFLPWTTFAPFGGVIVDRADRRRLILVTQAWRSLVMLALVVVVATDVVRIWHLYLVAYLITAGEILVDPAMVSIVPTIVPIRQLDRANGRLTTVETVTNDFAGGPVGAVTFGLVPWLPFALDAASYAGSVVPFRRLPRQARPEPAAAAASRSMRAEIGEGMRWIAGHPFLRPLTLAMAVFHLGTAGAFSMLVVLVRDALDAPTHTFGLALAAAAVGATLASLAAARLTDTFPRRNVYAGAGLLATMSVLATGAVVDQWQLFAAWTVNGAAMGLILAVGRGFVQRHTPNDRLGRAAIASRMITRSAFVVGALLAGAIAESTSVRWSFTVAAGLHLAGVVLLHLAFRHEPAPDS